jgi:23S rRNA pseudouridine2605 synthase
LKVNRLIRVTFGPFDLGDLDDGAVKEIPTIELRAKLGEQIVTEAGVDFDAPLNVDEPKTPPRRSGPRGGGRDHRNRKGAGPQAGARDRNENKKHRRDRSSGPRPSRPRPK